AFKPTPSIAVPQKSVNLASGENTELTVTGRHDPCVVPRAVPCVEAAVAIAIYDGLLGRRKELAGKETNLETYRESIDEIDGKLLKLFEERMELSGKIAKYKKANNIPVQDEKREAEKLTAIERQVADSNSDYAGRLYRLIFELSRECQNKKR
ncbi:MAG: chorismate synthase, partial [Firmicutes bacterium]|nr:chorismate synthase [Bacillota bacterium]